MSFFPPVRMDISQAQISQKANDDPFLPSEMKSKASQYSSRNSWKRTSDKKNKKISGFFAKKPAADGEDTSYQSRGDDGGLKNNTNVYQTSRKKN